MSPLAWRILSIFIERATRLHDGEFWLVHDHVASWSIGELLGGDRSTIDPVALKYTPRNPEEASLRELIDLKLVEEMAALPCRYRLIVKEEVQA